MLAAHEKKVIRYRPGPKTTAGTAPCINGRPGGARTPNSRFWRPVLYQLNYWPARVFFIRRVGQPSRHRPKKLSVPLCVWYAFVKLAVLLVLNPVRVETLVLVGYVVFNACIPGIPDKSYPAPCSHLFYNIGNNSGADGASAFTDSEPEPLVHGDRRNQLGRNLDVIAGITISTPSGRSSDPVTSVVRK